MQAPLDPHTHNGVAHASDTYITDLLGVAHQTHSREPTPIWMSTITLDIFHRRVWWRVATVNG